MPTNTVLIFAALLGLISATALARHFSKAPKTRNIFSVILVMLGMLTAFYFCFTGGTYVREHRQPIAVQSAQ